MGRTHQARPVYMKTFSLSDSVEKCSTFVDAMVMVELVASRSEAKNLISSGGFYVNGERLEADREISTDDLKFGTYLILRKGKKTHKLLRFDGVGRLMTTHNS